MRLLLSRLLLTLFACALSLRALIAPGLMPAASAHGVVLVVCPGQMGDHHPGQPATPACPFEAVAAPAMPEAPPMLFRAPVPMPATPAPLRLLQRAQGPPAPHPPATGPPSLA